MPTLANLRGAPEEEADALGDWLGAKNTKMRVRYSDERERTALLAKLTQAEILARMAGMDGVVSWQAVPTMLSQLDMEGIRAIITERMASESVEAEAPLEWVGHLSLVQQRKKFGLSCLKAQ